MQRWNHVPILIKNCPWLQIGLFESGIESWVQCLACSSFFTLGMQDHNSLLSISIENNGILFPCQVHPPPPLRRKRAGREIIRKGGRTESHTFLIDESPSSSRFLAYFNERSTVIFRMEIIPE